MNSLHFMLGFKRGAGAIMQQTGLLLFAAGMLIAMAHPNSAQAGDAGTLDTSWGGDGTISVTQPKFTTQTARLSVAHADGTISTLNPIVA